MDLDRRCLARDRSARIEPRRSHGCIARFNFLDERAADYYPDFEGALATSVALLRTEAGRDPHDPDLTELVGELATRSEAFRTRWGTHDVRLHRGGTKTFNHPVVGRMELAYDSMELVAAPGLVLTTYTAEPSTSSADNLALLASWAATEVASSVAMQEDSK
ncbi:MmyB family transcriptional regulator [Antrihabitans cavernicola]|uniref:MmyB-like transcription regulator ligand binding domain-containing protein n=1 Tax=Antrihabitans cavernicola TaxID=2495913 RepID=A0A5A7S5P8_9NOCA|nr:hypothetical protein [Spelaeibacter cavernicola]KAA0018502.1 hypothetical protein FOY51_23775 [Spelaeibacter cavernicola]